MLEELSARIGSALGSLLGDVRGAPGLDLQGEPTLVLHLDATRELPPLDLPPGSSIVVRDGVAPVGVTPQVVVHPAEAVRVGDVLTGMRCGGRAFHFVYGPGLSFTLSAQGALAFATSRSLRRRAARVSNLAERAEAGLGWRLDPPWPARRSSERAIELALTFSAQRWGPPPSDLGDGPLRIVHYVPHLGSGGAERQLSDLAGALASAGHTVSVLTSLPLSGGDDHYVESFQRAGVAVEHLPPHPRWRSLPDLVDREGGGLPAELTERLAQHAAAGDLIALLARLLPDPPDVLHCWLDEANATGGLAGLVAGIPRVLLSTWNVNPSHFPRFHKPWFQASYKLLSSSRRVLFSANSRAGAEDYAAWCGVSARRFRVVPNGVRVSAWTPLSEAERAAGRAELGIPADAFLVAGIFRLAPEKRPRDFLRALAAAREQIPNLRAIHMGRGELTETIHQLARELGLEDVLTFLGAVDTPRRFLGLADVSLLTSEVEGSPFVSQESQLLGLPMLLTRVVGSPETVREGETGFVFDVGDVEGMASRLAKLAGDRAGCRALGEEARAWTAREFSLEALLERSLGLYRRR